MENDEVDNDEVSDLISNVRKCHKIWIKFEKFIIKHYGKDLYGEPSYIELGGRKIKFQNFDEVKLSKRLVGYDVQCKIEKYVERYIPEIKVLRCDDSEYTSSIILLIPHPDHGITIIFIPQNTKIQNRFFLYGKHHKELIEALTEMSYVYKN